MTSTPATLTVTLVDGTQVVVPDSLEQITPYVLQEQGDWFEDEIKFLRRLVQPGPDGAGHRRQRGRLCPLPGPPGGPQRAGVGLRAGGRHRRSAAGASPPTAPAWLHLQRQALSDHTGSAWLQTPGQSELNSLATEHRALAKQVPLTTLDAGLDAFGWRQVDLLKIDAEGEEERIIAGGRRFFAELSPLVMFELKAGTELHLELVQRFQALGYSCYRLVPGPRCPDALRSCGRGGWLSAQPVRRQARARRGPGRRRLAGAQRQPRAPRTSRSWSPTTGAGCSPGCPTARPWPPPGRSTQAAQRRRGRTPGAVGLRPGPRPPIARRLGALQRSYRC